MKKYILLYSSIFYTQVEVGESLVGNMTRLDGGTARASEQTWAVQAQRPKTGEVRSYISPHLGASLGEATRAHWHAELSCAGLLRRKNKFYYR